MNKILLYYNTLKYLKPVQVYGRVFSILKKKTGLIRIPSTPLSLNNSLKAKTKFIYHDPWNSEEELLKRNFTFLNISGHIENWNAEDYSLLWQFNLHYFNYIHLLSKEEQKNICSSWIKENRDTNSVAWHPYVISLRIVNWCKAGIEDEAIYKSLYRQSAYLYRNLEYYHPANHYLENARALIFAGLYFANQGESDNWLRKGLEIYKKEIPLQVLNDGGYFERSIMYHSIMLEVFLDIINILPESNEMFAIFVREAKKMQTFINAATHPDGEIALFNDSTTEIAPSTKSLSEYANRLNRSINHPFWQSTNQSISQSTEQLKLQSFPESGYYIFQNKDIYFIIDAGPIGPSYIPAHAHADIFSYELSFKGKKFITDTGVYEYAPGEMRNYVRSTSAHNTIGIDGKNQAEMWGALRVAKRYDPYDVKFEEVNDKVIFEGKFGGYAKLIDDELVHTRKIELDINKSIITIEDNVTGRGNHLVESFIHVHPEVNVIEIDDGMELSREDVHLKLLIVNCKYSIEKGWYCPEFGKKIENKVIRLFSAKLPSKLSYKVIFDKE